MAFIGHASEVAPLLARGDRGDVLYVAASAAVAEVARGCGCECRTFADYADQESTSDMRKVGVEWIDAWADGEFAGGRSFKESVMYRGVTLWWFMLPVIFPDLLRCLQTVEGFRAVLELERPARVLVTDVRRRPRHPFRLNLDDNLLSAVVAATCEAERLPVQFVSPTLSSSLRSAVTIWFARLQRFAYYRGGRRVMGWLRRLAVRRAGGRARSGGATVIAMSSPVYWRNVVDEAGRRTSDDAIAGTTLAELGRRGFRVIGIDTELNLPGLKQFRVLREKRRSQLTEWHVIESYVSRVARETASRRRRALRALGRSVMQSLTMATSLNYEGVALTPLLRGRFEFLFAEHLNESMEYLDAVEVAVADENPSLLLLVYEEGPYGRAATVAGHWHGIPTVALQHGILSSPHIPNYYFAAVTTDAGKDAISCPVPTRTLVYGEQTREMLTRVSAYPESSVKVVGMPTYDPILRSLPHRSRSDMRRELGLEANAPVGLIVSQPFLNPEHRHFFVAKVLEVAAQMNQVQWVVKLHPSERPGAWDAYLGGRDMAGSVVVFTSYLHQLLVACDVMISWFSTTILEACLFARPVVALRVPGCWTPEDYIRDGLAVGVDGAVQLREALAELLDDDDERERLSARAAAAVNRYCYRAGGSATGRVADVVAELVGSGKQEVVA